MKKEILLLTFFIFIVNAYSQQNTFSKVLVDSSRSFYEQTSILTPDNGHLVTGRTEWELNKGLAFKTDSNGDFLWAKTFISEQSPSSWASFVFNAAINTIDSCYLLSGNFQSLTADKEEGLCVKITSDGDTVWSSSIVADHDLILNSICQTADSGYVVVGNVEWWESSRNEICKLFVAKLSPEGALQWSKTYSVDENYIIGYTVLQSDDGSLLISGNIEYYNKSFLLKLTETGTVVWAKEYGFNGTNYDYVDFQDVKTSGNGFIIYSFVKGFPALFQTDSAGNIVWEKTYTQNWPNGLINSYKLKFCGMQNGDYALITSSDFGGGFLKTDSLGTFIFGYDVMMMTIDISETVDNELFITGLGPLLGVFNRREDENSEIGLIQLDSLGLGAECVYSETFETIFDTIDVVSVSLTVENAGSESNAGFIVGSITIPQRNGCVSITSGVAETKAKNPVKVYPNPSTGKISVTLTDNESGNFLVYNSLGQQVSGQKLNQPQTEIDLSNQKAGIYFYKFITQDERVITGKIVLSK